MHPGENEASYSKRIYSSIQQTTTAPVFVANQRQSITTPVKLDLSAMKPIDGWTDIQSKKKNVALPQARADTTKKTMNSFSAIDNRSEHIVAKVNAENLFEHLDEWGDDDVKDIKLTVDYFQGAKVFEPNIGVYKDVVVRDYSKR
jgi:hypothetical protein